ncbi:zinc finger protein 574 [Periophthalmus magnuspinnatus]|uniref:zinc finger protein 574 n=1 Tax=Periophthalmus magnuspinnatus TaxID=409849 RepID=UPI00145AB899|nr:zinc finger protein 574 [Periophthalmus magnuspinnatus]XP_033836697.1 zinc finger protein 574 [Periophthalmus magnuspinnatus]
METSSVYMCFPCYQEFDTLEEVLKHQLTCTVEEEKPQAQGTAVTVPLLHPQQQVLDVARAVVQPLPQAQEPVTSPKKPAASLKEPDQPRILYQCGDCDELFKNLDLWQEHRKAGGCLQCAAKDKPDSDTNPETSAALSPATAVNPTSSSVLKDGVRENVAPEPEAEAAATAVAAALEQSEAPVEQPDPPVTEARAPASNPDESSPRRRDRSKKPKPEPVLLCVDCGSCFGLVPELVAHRKTQHGFEEALHRCGVCGESFLNTTLFLYHRKQHRQRGEEVAAQEVRAQSTIIEEPVKPMNVTVNFTQPKYFLCTECGQSYSTDHGLLSHRKTKHDLKKPLHTCSLCSAEFMNTTQYLYHRRQHRFISDSAEETTMTVETVITETQDSPSAKRILSPAAATVSCSPLAKKSRATFRVMSAGQKAIKSESDNGTTPTDANVGNYPPAKLLQDWSRTPLPHVCPYCGKTFTRRIFLRTHVYSHTGEKLFTCKVCSKSFNNSHSLLRHSLCHTGAKPYSCNICSKSFSQAATLKRHQQLHNVSQPRKKRGRRPVSAMGNDEDLLSCPRCPSMFSTEEQLNYHKLLHTSHPFPCSECGESFKRRKDLDLHSLTHQDKMPATCPHCSSQFINQTVLEIHLQRCPTNEDDRSAGRGRGQGRGRSTGQVECDLCGHRCMTQEGLDLHRLSHTGQTPLKCPVRPCRRRFISHSALEEHVLAHFQGTLHKSKSRARFRCSICHKEFAYNSTFKVHMRTHTDERPFECSTCGKRFRQLPHLQDHERIHSGLRPFCCWICGKSFSVAARLTEHARIHSGEKPYPCPHCSAAFRARANLEKHIRTHSDLPPETAAEVASAAEAAHVQKVLEGAKVLSSLSTSELDTAAAVQTIYVLQSGEDGTETVMIPSDQLAGLEGNSQVVILPSSVLGTQTIAVPTITMDGNEITMVEAGQSPHHSIEFIVEETI